jgi:hypothetical protein
MMSRFADDAESTAPRSTQPAALTLWLYWQASPLGQAPPFCSSSSSSAAVNHEQQHRYMPTADNTIDETVLDVMNAPSCKPIKQLRLTAISCCTTTHMWYKTVNHS